MTRAGSLVAAKEAQRTVSAKRHTTSRGRLHQLSAPRLLAGRRTTTNRGGKCTRKGFTLRFREPPSEEARRGRQRSGIGKLEQEHRADEDDKRTVISLLAGDHGLVGSTKGHLAEATCCDIRSPSSSPAKYTPLSFARLVRVSLR